MAQAQFSNPKGVSMNQMLSGLSVEKMFQFVRVDKSSFDIKNPSKEWVTETVYYPDNSEECTMVSFNKQGKVEAYWCWCLGGETPDPYIIMDYDTKGQLKSYCGFVDKLNFGGYCVVNEQANEVVYCHSYWSDNRGKEVFKFKRDQSKRIVSVTAELEEGTAYNCSLKYDAKGRLIEEKSTINGVIPFFSRQLTYNQKGLVETETMTSPNVGTVNYAYLYTYGKDGDWVKRMCYNEGKLVNRTEREYERIMGDPIY